MSIKTEEHARKMFLGDVEGHRMTVLRDDGLYRHVRFGKPSGSSMYRFDLVTWPGHLVITGDLQDYHFARLPDMFEFFRNNPDRPCINAQYWAEKLVGHRQIHEVYSFDQIKEEVVNHFLWSRDSIPEGRRAEVWRAIRREILEDWEVQHSEQVAYQTISQFQYRDWSIKSGYTTVFGGFTDVYEWNWKDYDHHFLVSLWAIVWGIAQWDARDHKTPVEWEREDHKRTRDELANLKRYVNL